MSRSEVTIDTTAAKGVEKDGMGWLVRTDKMRLQRRPIHWMRHGGRRRLGVVHDYSQRQPRLMDPRLRPNWPRRIRCCAAAASTTGRTRRVLHLDEVLWSLPRMLLGATESDRNTR